MIFVYARANGSIAHVWDMDYGAPEVDTTLVVQFDADTYPTEYQTLADNVKDVTYTGGALVLNATPIVDATWIAARNAEVATAATVQTAKTSILALSSKADNHASRIALCFAAVIESENLGEDANATFTRITNALNNGIVNNGYRAAVMTAFTAKTGLAFSFADLGVVVVTTKQAFNTFSADFFTRWAFMVDLR